MAFFDFLHIFTDLFNSAEKSWHKLEPDVQKALEHGSGVVKVISDNIEKTPDEVFSIIESKFPDLTKEKLQDGLTKVAAAFNLASPDLLTTIKNIQTYLEQFKGKFWDGLRSTIAQLLAIALAPDETVFGKIASLIEFVFHKKVK